MSACREKRRLGSFVAERFLQKLYGVIVIPLHCKKGSAVGTLKQSHIPQFSMVLVCPPHFIFYGV